MVRSRDASGKFKQKVTKEKLIETVRDCCEKAGGDVPASDIARELNLVRSSVSQMLRSAEKEKLVASRAVQDGNLILWRVINNP